MAVPPYPSHCFWPQSHLSYSQLPYAGRVTSFPGPHLMPGCLWAQPALTVAQPYLCDSRPAGARTSRQSSSCSRCLRSRAVMRASGRCVQLPPYSSIVGAYIRANTMYHNRGFGPAELLHVCSCALRARCVHMMYVCHQSSHVAHGGQCQCCETWH